MTKRETLQKQATDLGLEFDEKATVAQLEALISEQEARTFEKPEEEGVEETKGTEAVVKDDRGGFVRTYTKEKHGENFAELAQSFVSNPKRRSYTVTVQ